MASPETAEPEPSALPVADAETPMRGLPGIDRTAKLYIGGKQARPDSGYSYTVLGADGHPAGQAGLGKRKDIRNAVEAAHQAKDWGAATDHNRAQVLYYHAENLAARAAEFEARVAGLTGAAPEAAKEEVSLAIRRMFYYAAQADKFDGAVHATRTRNVTLAMVEPWGVMGIICPDEAPLLGFVSLVLPALALGNRVIAVPSSRHALIATDLYQVFDTSDLPPGVINIVTGGRDELAKILAQHDDVAALWYVGSHAGSTMVERESAGNLKATWVSHGRPLDWLSAEGQGTQYLCRASQVKNIWVPYGE